MSHHRVIVAVSGTIEDGFELRPNIDYRDPDGTVVPALFIGYGVFKGVKMYFDVKNIEAREYADTCPHRVNPAMVLTGNPLDMNQYSLYLVDERACLSALLGEPRFLTMTPDTIRLQLNDTDTSPSVRALAQAIIRSDMNNSNSRSELQLDEACVLAVVPCFHSKHFYPAPFRTRSSDGSRLTSFRYSLATFAGIDDVDEKTIMIGSPEWNQRVAQALETARALQANTTTTTTTATELIVSSHGDDLYGSDKKTARLSRRMTIGEFNKFCIAADIDIRAI